MIRYVAGLMSCTENEAVVVSKNDETELWVRLGGGKRVRVKDFGDNLSEFKKRVKKALG